MNNKDDFDFEKYTSVEDPFASFDTSKKQSEKTLTAEEEALQGNAFVENDEMEDILNLVEENLLFGEFEDAKTELNSITGTDKYSARTWKRNHRIWWLSLLIEFSAENIDALVEKGEAVLKSVNYEKALFYSKGTSDYTKYESLKNKFNNIRTSRENVFASGKKAYDESNFEEALKILRSFAEEGDAEAQWYVAMMYYGGKGIKQSYEEAFKWFSKSVEQGNARSLNSLGRMYCDGHYVTKDFNKAIEYYRLAAEKGYANAYNNLGVCYERGEGVNADIVEAAKYYRLAAEKGSPVGQKNLADFYRWGKGVKKDLEEAANWYLKAVEQGNEFAQFSLGEFYFSGWGVKENKAEAAKWYMKSAEQGNISAQIRVGNMYWSGNGVEKNVDEGLKWLRKAVEQGSIDAEWCIATNYFDEYFHSGDEEKFQKAIKWHTQAAEHGDIRSQYELGIIYGHLNDYSGGTKPETSSFKQDYIESVKWLNKAVDNPNDRGGFLGYALLTLAEINYQYTLGEDLGILYAKGVMEPPNFERAFELYRRLCDCDDYAQSAEGYFGYGRCLYYGHGVAKDEKKGMKYIKEAFDMGSIGAEIFLDELSK